MPQSHGLPELLRTAAVCHGVTTMSAAADAGVTRAQVRTGLRNGIWRMPHAGILVSTAAPWSWFQDCAIGVLASRGVASHRAAARIHGLDGFAEAPVEVTVSVDRHLRNVGCIAHTSGCLARSDRTTVNGIEVTSIARTLADLGAVVDDDKVEQALDDALRTGSNLRWITETLDRVDRRGPSGVTSLRRVLGRSDRHGPLPDSMFERLVERASVAAGVPQPVRQFPIRDAEGTLVAVLDAAWPSVRLGAEAHSSRWHDGSRRGRADQRRDNRLAGLGWELLYAGWWDVTHADEWARDLRGAYEIRSPRSADHEPGQP